ncbi:PP0621 family protein [Azoarcus olearius]|uniref:Hypothetical membrane protein n=1 Tax=Azoarcus sp. (strain BH72) TaxID=418699 RepID=A1KAW8_AZOSB|nr:PP0621 family protein [Azoarcus olearius]ANQ86518.1 hypothetical protein dqs_3497 [Azoarcus olearius]CAL95974.1 hypothetical membrane protein [Azoarcus olearius]
MAPGVRDKLPRFSGSQFSASFRPLPFPFEARLRVRYLILFLLILFAIWWIRRAAGGGARAPRKGPQDDSARQGEQMIECAHCGVHVPEREGVRDGGRFYCGEAHRRLGPARGR